MPQPLDPTPGRVLLPMLILGLSVVLWALVSLLLDYLHG